MGSSGPLLPFAFGLAGFGIRFRAAWQTFARTSIIIAIMGAAIIRPTVHNAILAMRYGILIGLKLGTQVLMGRNRHSGHGQDKGRELVAQESVVVSKSHAPSPLRPILTSRTEKHTAKSSEGSGANTLTDGPDRARWKRDLVPPAGIFDGKKKGEGPETSPEKGLAFLLARSSASPPVPYPHPARPWLRKRNLPFFLLQISSPKASNLFSGPFRYA